MISVKNTILKNASNFVGKRQPLSLELILGSSLSIWRSFPEKVCCMTAMNGSFKSCLIGSFKSYLIQGGSQMKFSTKTENLKFFQFLWQNLLKTFINIF